MDAGRVFTLLLKRLKATQLPFSFKKNFTPDQKHPLQFVIARLLSLLRDYSDRQHVKKSEELLCKRNSLEPARLDAECTSERFAPVLNRSRWPLWPSRLGTLMLY